MNILYWWLMCKKALKCIQSSIKAVSSEKNCSKGNLLLIWCGIIIKMAVLKTEGITWLLTRVPVVTYGGVQVVVCGNGLGIGKCVLPSFHWDRKFWGLVLMLIGVGRTLFQCDSWGLNGMSLIFKLS